MNAKKRRRLFIDIDVQAALMWRVALYWATFATAVMLMQCCWIALTGRPTSSFDLLRRAWVQCGPALVASALLLPLVMVDCLRLSNRFVGPIFRLRRAVRDLSHGLPADPVVLRRDDFWQEFATDFNRLAGKSPSVASQRPDDSSIAG